MIDKRLLNKYWIFSGIGVLLFFLAFRGCGEGKETTENNRINVEKVRSDTSVYLRLADSINVLLDTSFYGEYRVRPAEFIFYYLKNDSVRGVMDLAERTGDAIIPVLKNLQINDVRKYKDENFYRFQIRKSFEYRFQVLVLKPGETQFAFSAGSKVGKKKIVTDIKELDDDPEEYMLYKITDRILIYL